MTQATEQNFKDVAADMRRHLNVFWFGGGEVGMIFFAAEMPDEDVETQQFRGLEDYAPGLKPGSRKSSQELSKRLEPHLVRFFQEARLDPGDYDVPIAHLRNPVTGVLDISVRYMNYVQVPDADTMDFTVTKDHLVLLKNLRLGDLGGMLASDIKRPYGDMTYFALDIAYLLGEPGPVGEEGYFSKERETRYERLHEEMLLAAQALWSFGKL